MAIVSSVVVKDRARADGRRRILVHHTDHNAKVHRTRHLIGSGDNAQTVADAAGASLPSELAQAELQAMLERSLEKKLDPHTMTPEHSTQDEWLAWWLKVFATLPERSRWIWRFAQHMSTFTNDEIHTLLGEPRPQVTEWRGFVQAMRAARDDYGTHRIGPFPEARGVLADFDD